MKKRQKKLTERQLDSLAIQYEKLARQKERLEFDVKMLEASKKEWDKSCEAARTMLHSIESDLAPKFRSVVPLDRTIKCPSGTVYSASTYRFQKLDSVFLMDQLNVIMARWRMENRADPVVLLNASTQAQVFGNMHRGIAYNQAQFLQCNALPDSVLVFVSSHFIP